MKKILLSFMSVVFMAMLSWPATALTYAEEGVVLLAQSVNSGPLEVGWIDQKAHSGTVLANKDADPSWLDKVKLLPDIGGIDGDGVQISKRPTNNGIDDDNYASVDRPINGGHTDLKIPDIVSGIPGGGGGIDLAVLDENQGSLNVLHDDGGGGTAAIAAYPHTRILAANLGNPGLTDTLAATTSG